MGVGLALTGASLLTGLASGATKGGGNYSRRVRSINSRYRAERPQGYLTGEDLLNAERQRSRANKSFGAYSSNQRAAAITRSRQRGIDTSPALERTLGRQAQDEGRYMEGINTGVENQLYATQADREKFAREQSMFAWGSELGGAQRDWQTANARQGQFWNSLNPVLEDTIASFMGGGSLGTIMDSPLGTEVAADPYA